MKIGYCFNQMMRSGHVDLRGEMIICALLPFSLRSFANGRDISRQLYTGLPINSIFQKKEEEKSRMPNGVQKK